MTTLGFVCFILPVIIAVFLFLLSMVVDTHSSNFRKLIEYVDRNDGPYEETSCLLYIVIFLSIAVWYAAIPIVLIALIIWVCGKGLAKLIDNICDKYTITKTEEEKES